jgi:hypothetical protein
LICPICTGGKYTYTRHSDTYTYTNTYTKIGTPKSPFSKNCTRGKKGKEENRKRRIKNVPLNNHDFHMRASHPLIPNALL